jgi:cytochrome c oxidase cbb3-type subunit III
MNRHTVLQVLGFIASCLAISASGIVHAQGTREASPAALPVPATLTPQSFLPETIEAGRLRFASDCGFCHGRDTAGGTGGADLTRSQLVAEDVRGNLIGEVVRSGRAEAGMPSFATLTDADVDALVAYIHDQKTRAESLAGGRRSVLPQDLRTGSVRAGRRYFEANCTRCHSAQGDLADIGARLEGLTLLRRMLYPGSEGRSAAPPPARPAVTVTTRDGRTVAGDLAYQDEFTIGLIDADGRYWSWPTHAIEFTVTNPLEAHVEQLARYSDDDIHDVYAYLETLGRGDGESR